MHWPTKCLDKKREAIRNVTNGTFVLRKLFSIVVSELILIFKPIKVNDL